MSTIKMMRQRPPSQTTRQPQPYSTPTTTSLNDADAAAGLLSSVSHSAVAAAPKSMNSIKSDLEFFDDLVSEPVLVLGVDISHLSRRYQFLTCATGVFCFSLLYGFLQELISVQLCNRQLGLFLAVSQFTGYTLWSYLLRTYVYAKSTPSASSRSSSKHGSSTGTTPPSSSSQQHHFLMKPPAPSSAAVTTATAVPFIMYLGLSLLRAVDLGMTNLAMQYINYPAKTLMKSSRVVFTMLFGVMVARKRYKLMDYAVVMCMVSGLVMFMHADANSSAVFHSAGIVMLTISLLCDGAISNMSEAIMNQYGVGQDEFIFRMYSIALVAIVVAAIVKGDMYEGLLFLSQPGTYDELHAVPLEERTWSVPSKLLVMALFSTMGFFGSSCSAAITKNFGALTMSITSTARKATTLFLSFAIFDNECTLEHVAGIVLFVSALIMKSLRRGRASSASKRDKRKSGKSSAVTSRVGSRTNSSSELVELLNTHTESSNGTTAQVMMTNNKGHGVYHVV